jgi:hypothetical protein
VYEYGAVGQPQYVCVCGTKSSSDEQSSINIQSTSHNCWLRPVLGVAQQAGTKNNGKKLTEQSKWQYCKYCTSNAKKALVQSLVDFDFLFLMIFMIFFIVQATPE